MGPKKVIPVVSRGHWSSRRHLPWENIRSWLNQLLSICTIMSDLQKQKEIVVLGAGVIGLTTAVVLQEKGGYHVTIIAEIFPGDERSARYTSCWAGAHHVTLSGSDTRLHKIDKETFEFMWKLSGPGHTEGCFMRLKQQEFYEEGYGDGAQLNHYPEWKDISGNAAQTGITRGVEFETLTIDVPVYLPYLQARFLAKGGTISRAAVQHINQILEGGPYVFHNVPRMREKLAGKVPLHGLIVCTGLAARTLGGVEDRDVYPARGQTVLLRAPWVKSGRTLTGKDWSYIIPRRSGDVIVGGIKGVDDWYPLPREETRMDILRRGLALYPELAPPKIRRERQPTVEDLLPLVLEDLVGLRPMRKGGIRLEAQSVELKNGGTVPVVFNYGQCIKDVNKQEDICLKNVVAGGADCDGRFRLLWQERTLEPTTALRLEDRAAHKLKMSHQLGGVSDDSDQR
ncbi:hypothetical protein NP233_g4390 [Leucocoprinus birnbaumii]|uniref:FAD dependent oxidoreductase domain-containing protein n=1 Tax=Leucocoprinus birnbaumii TaxID=56174 RepID=A0AAD5YRW7_9AGAR|nr:hypothetical protein NP233_g4390 [Leucocoprinus birnbaumii]